MKFVEVYTALAAARGEARYLWGNVKPYLRHSHGCAIFSIAPAPRCNCGQLKLEAALDDALAAAAPDASPDSVRDTLAHALLGTPNVSVYGVGDDEENALTAADFMLREYDWPWPVAGGPAEPDLIAYIRHYEGLSDMPRTWHEAVNWVVKLIEERGSLPGGSPTGERE